MRILMTTDTVGGVWTFTEELAGDLLRRGCAIYLVSIGPPASPAQNAWCDQMQIQWHDSFHYEAVDAPLEWMPRNAGAYRDAAPRLLHLASTFRADILHSNQFCFGALPLDVPKVLTAHSDVFSWAQSCRGGALEPSEWLTRYSDLVKKGLRGSDPIVAPTQWMADTLANTFGLLTRPAVIFNGRTLPAVAETRNRSLQAVTAGRLWDEAKNVSLLMTIQSPIPIVIAGHTQHESAGISASLNNLTVLGHIPPDDLLAVFRESAIYICTSRYEPFGLAALEAALCGCAVLAYDIASLREVWGSAALYFDSSESLSVLLHQLKDDPSRLAAAQQRSMTRARTFSAERMGAAYYQTFQRALAAREEIVYAS
jgi:glycogen synthase